ncbi:hypothetical protein [Phenylobacterium sp.]
MRARHTEADTIKAHTVAAIATLAASNRAEAVFKARELGLI